MNQMAPHKPSSGSFPVFTCYFFHTGSATDTIQVKSLTLSPDPIVIPGSVNVSLDATITADIEAPTELKLVVKKKEFGVFIEIPCIDNLGSWYVSFKARF